MRRSGITLTELLIALGLLGLIAMFAVPKVLNSGGNPTAWNAAAKEMMRSVKDAYDLYRIETRPDGGTGPGDLAPYLNYVSLDTSGAKIDNVPTFGSLSCTSTFRCLRLHNGGVFRYRITQSFGGTGDLNAFYMEFDPDGKYSGTTNGPGKAVDIWLYYDGKIRTSGTIEVNTSNNFGSYSPDPALDPDWLSWN